jgi:hypothetical protein
MGYITREQVAEIGHELGATGYGKYLLQIAAEFEPHVG